MNDNAISPGSILIVPGREPVESIRRELTDAGLETLVPEDAVAAIEIAAELQPDLIVVEPGDDGQITTVLAALTPRAEEGTPILVLGGYRLAPLEALELYRLGATDVALPPHHPRLILARIGAMLRTKRRLDAARDLCMRDELTGLYNRRLFMERLEQEVARTVRTDQELALIVFDLDRFKKVNDTYGHPTGDALLQEVASVALKSTRVSDVLARLGGDEFALLLSDNTPVGAHICAEAMRRRLREVRVEGIPTITASFGIASYPHPLVKHPMKDLIHTADQALLRAKGLGRDCVVVAGGRGRGVAP